MNGDDPHVHTIEAFDSILIEFEDDLRTIQALQFEAAAPFDPGAEGSIMIPFKPGALIPRWSPPFEVPLDLDDDFGAIRDYLACRRALWLLWQSGAAYLVHRCFGTCQPPIEQNHEDPRDERRFVFAAPVCDRPGCHKSQSRHEQRFAGISEQLRRFWESV